VRREQVIELLHGALLPLARVNAAWLGGSDAYGRADELSDVDLQVDVDDGHVAATFRRGDALAALGLWHRHVLAPWSPSTGSATPPPATISAPATPATTCPPRSRRCWPSWRS
jgi:hypothetical protein